MDIRTESGTRYRYYYKWETKKNSPYNYDTEGLLKRIMSKVIINNDNIVLQEMLNFYDRSLVFMMKSIDYLKHFKNPHWKNR